MKLTLILLVALSVASIAQAKCYTSGFEFWPITKTIKQNSIFLIDGYADSQEIITGLGFTYKVYLRSGAQQIPLIVQQLLVGQVSLTQALLKPQRALDTGKQYELVIEDARNKGLNLAKTYRQETVV